MHTIQMAQETFPNGGTILEFGCGSGQYTAHIMGMIKKGWSCKLYSFDSFQGLPKETSGVYLPDRHKEGNFCFPKEMILQRLKGMEIEPGEQWILIEGWFKDTLTKELQQTLSNVIFVSVDIDIHSSCLEVLNFITPLLQKGTVIYFDDWGDAHDDKYFSGNWGEQLAFSQWSTANPHIKFGEDYHYPTCWQVTKVVKEIQNR